MSRYTIEKADIRAQKGDILALLQRNLDGISAERFEWNYIQAPAVCYVAKDSAGEIVGSCALFLRELSVNGQRCTAGIAGDFVVDKKHRAFGPAAMLQKTMLGNLGSDNISFAYSMPNNLSEPVLLRLGYKEIGIYRRFVKILRSAYKENKNILPAPLAGIASGITDLALKGISRETRYRRPSGLTVGTPEAFDERFSALFSSVSGRFGIIGARDSGFLNWRYKKSRYQDYRIFTISRDRSSLEGYLVYYIEDNVAYVPDMLFAEPGDTLTALLSEFSKKMRGEGVGSISIRHVGGALEPALRKMNFIEDKKTNIKVIIYADAASPLSGVIMDKSNWYLLEGDNDI